MHICMKPASQARHAGSGPGLKKKPLAEPELCRYNNSIPSGRLYMDNKGFTLAELMITVAIIAILAAVAVPIYNGYTMRARRADAYSAIQTIALGEEKAFAETGAYVDIDTLRDQTGAWRLNVPNTSDWSYEVYRFSITTNGITTNNQQFMILATPLSSRAGSTIARTSRPWPCMRSDGRQGFSTSGTGYDSCALGEWR